MNTMISTVQIVNLTDIIEPSTKLDTKIVNNLKKYGFGRNSIINAKVFGKLILESGNMDKMLTKHQGLLSRLINLEINRIGVIVDINYINN